MSPRGDTRSAILLHSWGMAKERIAVRFGKRLAATRKRKKLNQVDLAVRAGVSRSMIAMLETGKKAPSLKRCEVLAEALEMSLSQLFRGM